MDYQACAVPITEKLANVPSDARAIYEHSYTCHENIPIGAMAQEALAYIKELEARIAELEARIESLRSINNSQRDEMERLYGLTTSQPAAREGFLAVESSVISSMIMLAECGHIDATIVGLKKMLAAAPKQENENVSVPKM